MEKTLEDVNRGDKNIPEDGQENSGECRIPSLEANNVEEPLKGNENLILQEGDVSDHNRATLYSKTTRSQREHKKEERRSLEK